MEYKYGIGIGKYSYMLGMKFGLLSVREYAGRNNGNKVMLLCDCECGEQTIVNAPALLTGNTKSCGCYRKNNTGNLRRTHGKSNTSLYGVWKAMRKRCKSVNDSSYKYYGGKGIAVCKEWDSDFLNFEEWANKTGYEENLTIDRIDVNGNYCPENCRWVDFKTQANNKVNTIYVMYDGKKYPLTVLCEALGFNYRVALDRHLLGWPDEFLFKPKWYKYKKMKSHNNFIVKYNGEVVELWQLCMDKGFDYVLAVDRRRNGWPDEYLFEPEGFRYKLLYESKYLVEYNGEKRPIVEICKEIGFKYEIATSRFNSGWPDEFLFKPKGFSYKRYLKEQQKKQQEASAS